MHSSKVDFSAIPSVDRVLQHPCLQSLIAEHGRASAVAAVRACLSGLRDLASCGKLVPADLDGKAIAGQVGALLAAASAPRLRPVFNLTGTVLHTNLGRAPLPEEAVRAVALALTRPCSLEYDLDSAGRSERDERVEPLLCELTGAEAATVVNNNAGAVFLALNTLAARKEVVVSRGELIEIGGSFRIPDIMTRSGAKLKEVGTTNRTYLKDFEEAIGGKTALLLKVHTSNYAIQGFTASVCERDLAALARMRGLPFLVDLGSGTLVNLMRWGLPQEPTVQEALANGADLVTFSGDKLLGGPQAGIVVGRKALIAKLRKNPLKRALRVGKLTLAALEAVLRLYRDPERLAERLPALRLLTRPAAEIAELGVRLLPPVQSALEGRAQVQIKPCLSQIGSGSAPVARLASAALVITPAVRGRGAGTALKRLEAAFRGLPQPVIGRIEDQALWFDLRCLEDEKEFVGQLAHLRLEP